MRDRHGRYDGGTAGVEFPKSRKQVHGSLGKVAARTEVDSRPRVLRHVWTEREQTFAGLNDRCVEPQRCARRIMARELPR